jgi:glycosyltransferase involved in cell wall biosynthesis
MATYNGEKYLKEQLDSILCQLSDGDEVIVSDDGSTDNTLGIIAGYNDARIKVFHNKNRKGVVGNFENALNQAQGDYIFLSDQDDVWLPDKVSVSLDYLQKYDLIQSDCQAVDVNLNIINPSFFALYHTRNGVLYNLLHNSYHGCCIAFRKELLAICLPIPKRIPMHDIWFGFVTELFFKPYFIPNALVKFRRKENSASWSMDVSRYNFLEKLSFRWNIIRYIPLLVWRIINKKKQ